ncbi:hypothetical protein [Nocardioides sp. SYSU DS0663]|uniref:hypothetical protein n=1 Tax=Nocardioides sp. SYSU DS0663 TaxID=3416445 RepID=UPI003F4B13C0
MHRLNQPENAGTHAGRVAVPHSSTRLAHGLEPGEGVVLDSPSGEHHLATVVDLEFTLDDTIYVLEVGTRVPAETAERLATGAAEPAGEEGTTDVMRLLGELRRRGVRQAC